MNARSAEQVKVSLVATVKDSAAEVGDFLASVAGQTRPPDEVVIVDGGSTDGTLDILRGADGITLIEEPGANIARGRNVAVRAASHDVIAVSDADCVLSPNWLERILEPIESGADVAMGSYRPIARGFFQACSAAVAVPQTDELRADSFLPSARSVAFRRHAYKAGGGYPEWLDVGEDMHLNLRWRDLGLRMELAPDAVTLWRVRPNVGDHWRQYVRYAEGDALAGMHARRHLIRFGVYGTLATALLTRRKGLLATAAGAGALYAARPIRRARALLPPGSGRRAAALAVPALMALTDVAKLVGYGSGMLRRWRGNRSRDGAHPLRG